MDYIEKFKVQAKMLCKDLQTQYFDEEGLHQYKPKYFEDIDDLVISMDTAHEPVSLMKTQHYVALLSGFKNWNDLIHSSEERQELGFLLFQHREEYMLEDWEMYESQLPLNLDDASKLEIFKAVFLDENK